MMSFNQAGGLKKTKFHLASDGHPELADVLELRTSVVGDDFCSLNKMFEMQTGDLEMRDLKQVSINIHTQHR